MFGFYTGWFYFLFLLLEKKIITTILFSLIYFKILYNPFFLNKNGSLWTYSLSYLLP